MSSNNQDQVNVFAAQATERYDAFIAWMTGHWPQQSDPLTPADFGAGRREMDLLLGAKLHAGGDHGQPTENVAATDEKSDSNQYLPVTPAPWP